MKARAVIVALIGGAMTLGAATPAAAGDVRLDAQLRLGVEADGTLYVEEAKGTISFGHEIASPRDLVWHIDAEDRPVIVGRLVNPVVIQELTIHFSPVRERAQGRPADIPGAVTVIILPERSTPRCSSSLWNPATAQITYDDGEGSVKVLSAGARYATTSQFDPRGAECHGAMSRAQMDGAILVVSAADGPMQ